ncbi:hypothetical protein [Mycobacterium hubeiense]|uniref:hypothetical protein n=1 Tax=Mycobacterium hubeiense TaxID=1867256 RepID=UPI000C7ECF93|nr:hypothetical protein [Mycobacterium sp. QGD 101]
MRLPDALDAVMADTGDPRASQVYGQPYETADGTTVIPVAKVRGRSKPGADSESRLLAKPVGVFVIKDGTVTWQPAVDVTRIALMGELIGLVAATLATVAMVRRPPWPDLKISRRT